MITLKKKFYVHLAFFNLTRHKVVDRISLLTVTLPFTWWSVIYYKQILILIDIKLFQVSCYNSLHVDGMESFPWNKDMFITWHPKDWNQRASLDIPRKSATFMKSAFALIRCVILDWKWMLRRLLFIVSITSINIRLKDNCEIPCKSAASDWTFPLKRTLKVDSTF